MGDTEANTHALRLKIKAGVFAVAFAGCLMLNRLYAVASGETTLSHIDRALSQQEESECDGSFDSIPVLPVLVYIIAVILICTSYLFLCEGYLIYALEVISGRLKLSEDVAGATFLAAGSSSPELFSNFADIFIYENSIGVGTVIGSCVFNILCALGVVAIISPGTSDINAQGVVRDTIYFSIAICMVLGFFDDGLVEWYESVILVVTYFIYVVHLSYNDEVLALFGIAPQATVTDKNLTETATESSTSITDIAMEEVVATTDQKAEVSDAAKDSDSQAMAAEKEAQRIKLTRKRNLSFSESTSHVVVAQDDTEETTTHGGCCSVFSHYIGLPANLLFYYTVPRCNTPDTKHRWYLTFIICILYFIGLSWIMVISGTHLGCLLGIDPVVMGVTFLAIATSLPDALGGLIAARRGHTGMCLSNSLGSNIFDICFALGLPWIIFSLTEGEAVIIEDSALIGPCIWMFFSAFVLLAGLRFNNWKLSKPMGYAFLFLYFLFLLYSLLLDE